MQFQLIKQDFAEADQQSIVQLNLQQVRKQTNRTFSRRQSVLAAFFDVKKAYDQVWHARLLHTFLLKKSVSPEMSMNIYIKKKNLPRSEKY